MCLILDAYLPPRRAVPRRKKQESHPPYIPLEEAIRLMTGVVSRSAFFSHYRQDPQIISRLDIRRDPKRRRSTTCDRQAVLEWLEELRSEHHPATAPDPNAGNLGSHADRRGTSPGSYGDALAALCRALEEGLIRREQFARAVTDLESAMES